MSFMQPKVVIIIPNFNGKIHLAYCLPALFAQSYQNFQVVLVDNGSSDNSLQFITQHFPQVEILASSHNLGFAKANNIAIQMTSAPYIVTLNNDTVVAKDWLAEMIKEIERNPQVGMIACKVLYLQAPHLIDSMGLEIDQVGMASARGNNQPENKAEITPYPVFCPSGAAALYRRTMLEEIGLFDEAFFAYCEDMDLGWRGRLNGWQCLYVPTARVYHAHSATSKSNSPFKRYLISRNRIWTVIKNYPDIWRNSFKLIFYDMLALLYRTIKEKNLAPLQGRVAIFSQLKWMLQQRHIIQQNRTITSQQLKAFMLTPINLLTPFQAK